jgi:hypothetical protein
VSAARIRDHLIDQLSTPARCALARVVDVMLERFSNQLGARDVTAFGDTIELTHERLR